MSRVRVGLAKKNYMKDGCDSMRKGMKVFAAVIAAATASTMSLSAFAAPSITTTTSYSGDDVTVTTAVTGAAASEEVAYLVYKSNMEPTADGAILYIDQKTASEAGAASFSFTAAKDTVINSVGSTVKVGTSSIANNAELTDATTLKVSNFTITYSSNGNGKAYAIVGSATDETGTVTTSGEVTFAVTADPGYKLAAITKNGDAIASYTMTDNLVTLTVAADDVIAFTFAEKSGEAVSATTSANGGAVSYAENANNSAFARGKAAGSIKEAGMFISASQEALAAQKDSNSDSIVTGTAKIGKFIALALGSDGSFAIELKEDMTSESKPTDYAAFITSATMYALTYVVKADGSVSFGDVVQIAA